MLWAFALIVEDHDAMAFRRLNNFEDPSVPLALYSYSKLLGQGSGQSVPSEV